jgi:hypothetical protein
MNEDSILDAAITYLQSGDWRLTYRTRPVAESAIAGVDAILFNATLSTFRLVDAKGESNSPASRSTAFANCLGTLLKRIRFQSGYLHLETKALFTPPNGMSTDEFRKTCGRMPSTEIANIGSCFRRPCGRLYSTQLILLWPGYCGYISCLLTLMAMSNGSDGDKRRTTRRST